MAPDTVMHYFSLRGVEYTVYWKMINIKLFILTRLLFFFFFVNCREYLFDEPLLKESVKFD
jgi:hypothetical protein